MAQILPMGLIKQHKCRVGAVLPPGSHEGLSLAGLTLSPAKHLPTASFEHRLAQAFSLFSPWQLIDRLLPACCVGVSVHYAFLWTFRKVLKTQDGTARAPALEFIGREARHPPFH